MRAETQKKLSVVPIPTNDARIKEILSEWSEMDDIEEIFILGKVKGRQFRWEFSKMRSLLFWMGFFNFMASMLCDWQKE